MRPITYLAIICLAVGVNSFSYFLGDVSGKHKLFHREKVVYQFIPLKKRVKSYQYRGPSNLVIKAIHCYDYKNGEATVNVTDGGIGTNHFALRLKSERSQKLDFEIEVYT